MLFRTLNFKWIGEQQIWSQIVFWLLIYSIISDPDLFEIMVDSNTFHEFIDGMLEQGKVRIRTIT